MDNLRLDAARMVLIQAASGLEAPCMLLDAPWMPWMPPGCFWHPGCHRVGDARADALASGPYTTVTWSFSVYFPWHANLFPIMQLQSRAIA